jgi:hypothetical protein
VASSKTTILFLYKRARAKHINYFYPTLKTLEEMDISVFKLDGNDSTVLRNPTSSNTYMI